MKKFKIATIILMAVLMTNCATVFGGKVTASQKRKPAPGEQQRQVRPWYMVADIILFLPGLIVDFATGAIYKPN
ncbi:MAG: hypothetical protein HKP45_05385 [Winogradskyella sp.]|nr:hypothetical protein [Bacteroidia bacterium]NNK40070.1 hypothetical protein [Winogradskyella sp.]